MLPLSLAVFAFLKLALHKVYHLLGRMKRGKRNLSCVIHFAAVSFAFLSNHSV